MTVDSTANRASYTGNGVTTAFAFPYYFQMAADLVVLETVIATGIQTIRTLTADYTVTGTTDANGFFPNGGTINAVVAPSALVTWTIYRDPARTQLTQHVDGDSMPAASIDGPLDKLTMIVQRHDDILARALRQPDGDVVNLNTLPTVVIRANGGLGSIAGWDGTGQPTTLAVAASGVQTSVAMGPVITAATLALARTNMGVPGLTDNNTFSGTQTHNGAVTFNSPEGNAAALTMSGAPINEAQGTNIASAATTAIGAATGNYVKVTGVVTITAFDTVQAGVRRIVEFTGALILTNSANVILPGGQNITTAAGDTAVFVSEGAGVWRCVSYQLAVNSPSSVLARVTATTTFNTSAGGTALTLAIPANLLGTNRALEFFFFGDYLNNSGGAANFEIAGTYGGSTFFDTGVISETSNAATRPWRVRGVLQAHGATNAQFADVTVDFSGATGANVASSGTDTVSGTQYDNLTVDSTAAQNFVITITQSNNAAVTTKFKGGYVRLI